MARSEKEGFDSRKIMTIFLGSRHLVLKSLGNLMVCESLGKETCCVREKRITPSAPSLRQVTLLFDFFLSLIFLFVGLS